MNPISILDSILVDYASPRARRLMHSLIFLGVALVMVWQAAEGDWKKALLALAATVYAAANKANTDTSAGMVDGVGFYDADTEGSA